MAHYLVTGAAGFIASRVSEMLLDAGHTVYGVDNLNNAYDVRVKEYRLKKLTVRPGFKFKRMDISHWEEVEELGDEIEKVDAVINLAARSGVRASLIDPWVFIETNITGTLNLLELCCRQKISKFILASTSGLYGSKNPMPFKEDAGTDHPLQPYAASKKGAEALCYTYHYLYNIDVTVFRYFTVYGPAGRPDMVMFRFTQWINEGRAVRINGDGEQSRGFTYLDDIARGTILGLKPLGYEIINLGGHEVIKINDMIHMLEKRLGRKANVEYQPLHPADLLANWANVEKAKAMLGWEPQVPIDEGVDRLVAWYLKERSWVSQVLTP
jgi:UDP-glucuronate 4-epimerase